MALAPVPFAVWRRNGLYSTPQLDIPEAITSTFKIGSLLVITSGYATEASTDPTAIAGVATAAGQNGAANGTFTTQMIPPVFNLVFQGTLDAGSGTYALLQADLGAQYGVLKDSGTGIWYIDQTETSNKRVTIVELIDPVGTLAGRVGFQFISDFCMIGLHS